MCSFDSDEVPEAETMQLIRPTIKVVVKRKEPPRTIQSFQCLPYPLAPNRRKICSEKEVTKHLQAPITKPVLPKCQRRAKNRTFPNINIKIKEEQKESIGRRKSLVRVMFQSFHQDLKLEPCYVSDKNTRNHQKSCRRVQFVPAKKSFFEMFMHQSNLLQTKTDTRSFTIALKNLLPYPRSNMNIS